MRVYFVFGKFSTQFGQFFMVVNVQILKTKKPSGHTASAVV